MPFCTECATPYSSDSKFCNQCGMTLPIFKNKDRNPEKLETHSKIEEPPHEQYRKMAIVVSILVIASLVGLIFALNNPGSLNPSANPLPDEAEIHKKSAERVVLSTLKDPNSAIFSEERYQKYSGCVFGKVNSKNGFGGYAGNQPFVVDGGGQVKFGGDEPFSDMIIQQDCQFLDAQNQLKTEKDPALRASLENVVKVIKETKLKLEK